MTIKKTMKQLFYGINKAYLFGFFFAFGLITCVFYLAYILNQKLDEVSETNKKLNETIIQIKHLTNQFSDLQSDYLKLLNENQALKLEISSKIANDSSTITLMSDAMSDEYKMLITLVFIVLLLLSMCGVTYYSAFCFNSVVSKTFVVNSFVGLKSFALKFLNSIIGYDVLKELTYADHLNNLFRIVISADGKTCDVAIKLSGQDSWMHLDTFIEQHSILLSRVMTDNSLVLSGVGNIPSEASSNLVSEVGTHLTAALESAVIDGEAAELASKLAWMLEFT